MEEPSSPEEPEIEELFEESTDANSEEAVPEDSGPEKSPEIESASVSDDLQDQIADSADSEEAESPIEPETEMPDEILSAFAESEDTLLDSAQMEETQVAEEELPEKGMSILSASEEPPEIDAEPASDLDSVLAEYGYAYLRVKGKTPVFSLSSCNEADHFFTITDGILLVTSALEQEDGNVLRVWFVSDDQFVCTYTCEDDLEKAPLTPEEVELLSREETCEITFADVGELLVFAVEGEAISVPTAEKTPEVTAFAGSFVSVTIDTRAFTQVDDSANDEGGEFFDGY